MSWWYVSSPSITGAVEVRDDIVTDAPPILRKFIGQPAKNLGSWLRSQGDVSFEKLGVKTFPYAYAWGNNEKRVTFKGRPCRILARGSMRSVMVEFENGERTITSHRALRKRENT